MQALALAKFAATVLFTSLTQPAAPAHTPGTSLTQAPPQTPPQADAAASHHKQQQQQQQQPAAKKELSRRARRIMTIIGCLDVVSYASHCVGFALCGAATASVVFAASAQVILQAI